MPYQPIENYGVIGDMHTVALVSMEGGIDWYCFPHFDSPSVFAAILDEKKGGSFQIGPASRGHTCKQFYWPETNVLVTRFLSPGGVGQVIDYMPIDEGLGHPGHHWLVRQVEVVRGQMKFHADCVPAFDYGRQPHRTHVSAEGAVFESDGLSLALSTSVPLKKWGAGVRAGFTLREGEKVVFVLREPPLEGAPPQLGGDQSFKLFKRTVDYWRNWVSKSTYRGRWREMVHRSALTLKLLTFEDTGAIVAAPTASLPEGIGGERNWDYRYTWIRDAAFTLYGLMRVGFTQEAAHFMKWLDARCHELEEDGSLQIMYGIDGRHELPETVLSHLEGYRGSRPVRIGNAAHNHLQLDIYGELMDSVYLFDKYGAPISPELWTHLSRLIDWVAEHWREPDEGIWEVRGGRRHFVYSKMMCWVAMDRALRLAKKRSLAAPKERWSKVRDEIHQDIMTHGWSEKRGAFVQSYGSTTLDASTLLMPLTFFISPTDERMLKTLDEILKSPGKGGLTSDGLVYRYDVDKSPDGLKGDEGSFNICTFWLVEALTRAGKSDPERLDRARLIFEQMLGYSNHLGLYAEETGRRGEALGNYPQAFTHLGLISAAYNLDRALEVEGKKG